MIKKFIFVLTALLLLVSVTGCGLGNKIQYVVVTATPETPGSDSTSQGSNALGGGGGNSATQPTVAPQPTIEPTVGAQEFYTENFDPNSGTEQYYGGWTYSSDEISSYLQNGKLWFEIKKNNWWYAMTYDAFTYTDVSLTVNAEAQGDNSNAVILMCRFTPKVGRYEFIIGSNGLWEIRDVHYEGDVQAWDTIANGGSGKIKPGNAINEYSISCLNQTLSLYINGSKAWKGDVSQSLPQYTDGKIGFGATSENGNPVLIGFDWIKIAQP